MSQDDDDLWSDHISRPAQSGILWTDPPDGAHPFETGEAARYIRKSLLGKGGMGRVLAVEDARLGRQVALKETLQPGSTEIAARLAREAAITARLEHPGIVPVYDAGRSEDGRLFYTMRLIQGRSLAEAIKRTSALSQRLPLLRGFLLVCQAVAYAHGQGVLHRDLKPDNIMLGPLGQALVVDWGLACLVNEAAAIGPLPDAITPRSIAGVAMGTPAYMSPEQAAGAALDARADVWSLGAVLYEILTGTPPFSGSDPPAVLRQTLTRDPTPITSLQPEAPAELITIVSTAMARDPSARYPTAEALAADVARYLDGRLVTAHSYTPIQHLDRLIHLWRTPFLVAVVAAVLLVGLGIDSWQRTSAERTRALAAEAEATAARIQSDANLQVSLIAQALSAQSIGARAEAETLAAHALVLGESPEARGVLAAFATRQRPRYLGTSPVLDCIERMLSPSADHILCLEADTTSLWSTAPVAMKWRQPITVSNAAFSHDGARVIVQLSDPRSGHILSAEDGTLLTDLKVGLPSLDHLFSAGPGAAYSHTIRELFGIDVNSGVIIPLEPPCDQKIYTMAADARARLAIACADRMVLWPSGGEPTPLTASRIANDTNAYGATWIATFSPSSTLLALGSLEGVVEVLDVTPGQPPKHRALLKIGEGIINRLTFSPDEEAVVVVLENGRTVIWRLDSGALSPIPSANTRDVGFAGETLLILQDALHRWQLPEADMPERLTTNSGISSVAMSPDGLTLAAALGDSQVVAWSMEDGSVRFKQRMATDDVIKDLAFTPDGQQIISVGVGVKIDQTDATTGQPGAAIGSHNHRRVGVMADGMIWAMSWTGLRAWQDGEPVPSLSIPGRVFFEGETAHGRLFAAMADENGDLYRLSARPAPTMERIIQGASPVAIDITADGAVLAWSEKRRILLADASSGQPLLEIPRTDVCIDLAFSPDGKWLAAADIHRVTLYDAATGITLATLYGHIERAYTVEFSDDGRILISGGWDQVVRLWGMTALTRDPVAILDDIKQAWGLSLEDALLTR